MYNLYVIKEQETLELPMGEYIGPYIESEDEGP